MKAAIIEILSGGTGSYTKDESLDIYSNIVPGMFELAAKGLLNVPVQAEPLEKIESVWNKNRRLAGASFSLYDLLCFLILYDLASLFGNSKLTTKNSDPES